MSVTQKRQNWIVFLNVDLECTNVVSPLLAVFPAVKRDQISSAMFSIIIIVIIEIGFRLNIFSWHCFVIHKYSHHKSLECRSVE